MAFFFFTKGRPHLYLKMEDNLKKIMIPKTIKTKNNNIFENRRPPHVFFKGSGPFLNGGRFKKNNATQKY